MQNGSQFEFAKNLSVWDNCAFWCEVSYERCGMKEFQIGKFVISYGMTLSKMAKMSVCIFFEKWMRNAFRMIWYRKSR